MRIEYKNKNLEKFILGLNTITCSMVITSFVLLFGFDQPIVKVSWLYDAQVAAFILLIFEKLIRFFNAKTKKEFFRLYWFELPLLLILAGVCIWGQGHYKIKALRVYQVIQVVDKLCRTSVSFAASGRNPTRTLIISFVVLIFGGAGFLSLPKSYTCEKLSFVDALFTTTSAVCVTGLVVKDTGTDFTRMGQSVILVLIQLGGLGIVIFGAVFAMLLGQAFSVRETVAMQDLLNARTLNRLGNMIGFIFMGTLIIESVGAFLLMRMWNSVDAVELSYNQKLYYSVFHSISAFCNAGFGLFSDSLTRYRSCWQVYLIFCPLIVLGGLGFGVLYNLFDVMVNRIKYYYIKFKSRGSAFIYLEPRRLTLQSKIVISTSLILIALGMAVILILENNHPGSGIRYAQGDKTRLLDALFQSVTSRTAGFNTIDNALMSDANKLFTMILMLIGGSPGSTAGGIKTVTLVVIVMAAMATLLKRNEVEVFNRSIRTVFVGRAITVVILFFLAFCIATFGLCITERHSNLRMIDIMFEAASALGTVGLSAGITSSLTNAGKLIIIASMLIGRLGPLTLLTSLTFNLRVHKYSYPDEPVVIG